MSRNRLMTVLGVLIALAMFATACAPATTAPNATTAPATAAATTAPATQAPAPTATAAPHMGGWLDQVVFSVVDQSSAITQLQAGAIDIYAGGLAAADYPNITKANLAYAEFERPAVLDHVQPGYLHG